jgi:crotonobetainyl-CoA:carnitine CoA-transferase CaiB-like acyl-CoA transferase
MVADLMLQRTTAECTALLDAADIPVAPLQTVDQLVDDPHLSAKGFYVDMNHPTEGRLKIPGIAAQFSATKAEIGRPAPRLGEQSREILKAAGYSDEAADKLFNAGISVEPR